MEEAIQTNIKVFGIGRSTVDELTKVSELRGGNVTTVLVDGGLPNEAVFQDVDVAIIHVGGAGDIVKAQEVGAIAKSKGILTIAVTQTGISLDKSSVDLTITTNDETIPFLESVVSHIVNLLDSDVCIELGDLKEFIANSNIGKFSIYDEKSDICFTKATGKLLVSVTAKNTVSLEDVSALMNDISEKMSPEADVIFSMKMTESSSKDIEASIIVVEES